jgi:hypothetical protein
VEERWEWFGLVFAVLFGIDESTLGTGLQFVDGGSEGFLVGKELW